MGAYIINIVPRNSGLFRWTVRANEQDWIRSPKHGEIKNMYYSFKGLKTTNPDTM